MQAVSPAIHHGRFVPHLRPFARLHLYRLLHPRPPYRAVRPRVPRPFLRIPRGLAIRLGPDLIALRRERIVGRVLNGRIERDRFTPSAPADSCPANRTYDCAGQPTSQSNHCAAVEARLARAERDLAVAERRWRGVESGWGASSAPGARAMFDEPVAYAYRWVPPEPSGGCPPAVVSVPGVVRAHIDPTGRLVDVLM